MNELFAKSSESGDRKNIVNTIALNLCLAFVYFLLAKLGLTLASLNHSASPVWPATGFAFSILYLFGNRVIFAVALGAFAANSFTGGSFASTLIITFGNSLEAWVGALLIHKILSYRKRIGTQAETVAFVSASFFASVFSASIGVWGLYVTGALSKELIGPVWVTWWIGDSLGGLVVAPILLKIRDFKFELEKRISYLCLICFSAAAIYFVFFSGVGGAYLFLLFPVLLYAARNVGIFLTLGVSGVVCIAGIFVTAYGSGPFAVGNFNERLIHLQLFLAAYALTALVLSAFGRKNLTRLTSSVLMICWMLAGVIFHSFDRSEAKRTEEHFSYLIRSAEAKTRALVASYEEVLRGGVGLFAASKSVEFEEWKAYNSVLNITRHHSGMNGLGVIWPIQFKHLRKFQKEMQSEGLPAYEIKAVPGFEVEKPSQESSLYVIKFIEPTSLNFAAIGLDIGSEPNRREAAEKSRDAGVGVLSSNIVLVQDQKKTPGSLFFLPIYEKNANLNSVEDRRRALVGWVYSPILYDNFFTEMFRRTSDEIELRVFEGSSSGSKVLIFDNFSSTKEASFARETSVQLGKRDFILRWRKSPTFVSSHDTVVAWVGLCGAIATLLLGHLLIVIQSVGSRSREIANELTAELSTSREKFQEGERRLLYALDGSNDGIWDWNIEKSEMYVSGKIALTHGWPQTFRARSSKDLQEFAHPDDLDAIDRSIGNLLKGVSSSHEVETRYRTVNGEWRWVLTRGKVSERSPDGKPLRMTGVHIDIHDLKISQHGLEIAQYKLTNIANSVPAKISLWNKNLKCEFSNQLFADWFGLRVDQVTGRSMRDVLAPDVFAERMPFFQRALDGESLKYERDVVRPADGERRHVVATYLPNESDGTADGFFLFIQDITDLKKAELSAIEERKVAIEATNIKSQFLANMSHEIRTPLNGIIGMLNLLSSTALSEKQREYAGLISQSSDVLLNLINDILDFSKAEAGKLELESVDFSLRHLLLAIVNSMSFAAEDKHLRLEKRLELGEREYFKGDSGRIRQILTNLIGNAIKFTQAGSVRLRVVVEEKIDRAIVKFEVIDTGIGISPEARDKMFKAFSQADASTTRKFGGTGLGLSICKQLVSLMGGEIGVESDHSVGSNFWFSLELPYGSPVNAGSDSRNLKVTTGARILVVEDNRVNQQIAIELLENLGYSPHAVGNGIEALEALREINYDLVLMDCQMPDMDGFQATDAIRRSDRPELKSLPVVAMTANAMIEDREKCLAAGMDDFVSKPVDEGRLVAAIEKNLKISADKNRLAIQSKKLGHILVVEDNKVNQNVICLHLEELGYSYAVAENGIRAIEFLSRESCDLVLMDCQMPEMDGYEATQKVRSSPNVNVSSIPIVALTANAMKGDREKCLEAGMNDYLAKPIDFEKLEKTLAKWIGKNVLSVRGEIVDMGTGKVSSVIDMVAIENLNMLQKPGRPNLLTNLINLFFETAHEGMDQVRVAAKGKDLSALSAAAHSLKSSAANLGAMGFSELCLQLEMLGEGQVPIEKLEDLLLRLEKEYLDVLRELESLKSAA